MTFGPLCTLFHDASARPASAGEVRWFAGRLPRDAGPVLDLMCGSGRMTLPLLRAGFRVHGVDRSATMLDACARRLADAGVAAPLFRQDVAALNLPFRYGGAFFAGNAFALLFDPVAAGEALRLVAAHLVPPAVLLIDLDVPAGADHRPGAPSVEVRGLVLADGSRIALRSETSIEPEGRRLDQRNRYERRERDRTVAREDETLTRTWYREDEIVALLADAGFDARVEHPLPWAGDDAHRFAVVARLREPLLPMDE